MITGNLEHPSIVPVYDYGGDRERGPYYSMRVIRERNLSQILREMRENPDAEQFTTNQLLNILRQVLLAVHFAHERGVVHRDLKPENILIGEYGEVYVIDWGVAKIDPARLGIGGVETIEGVAVGSLVGTPQYMAPEQARGHNESIDARSDIYAMGTVLYEMLTLEPVFKVDSVLALLYHVAHETPTSPSMRAPSRHISSKLDEICLRALAKNPDNRFQSAQDFADAIKLYLEGVKERERRLQRAEQARDRADEAREVYRRRRKTYIQKSRELAALRLRVPSHAPAAEKRPLWDLEQEVEDTSIELEQLFGETIRRYGSALSHRPDDPETRRTLSDLYWERFRQAELSDNRAEAAYFESLVRQYDDGRYQSLLEGEARLGLRSEPPSAGVSLYRYESTQYRLVENRVRDLGVSPISATSVPHGSYLLVVERDGYVPLRIPVRLDRMQTRSLDIRLWREDELPAGFVVISAGDFLQGTLQPADLEAARTEVPVFAIMRYPVTCAQYIDFLNALARESPERAARHAPRTSEDAESYFPVDSDGLYYLPREDREGDAWDPHWPICLVNYHDAHAFAEWMTRRDGRNYRLPTALEWEKAARGVDGRLYPWGNHFDASFCNMRESSRGKPMPVPVGSFPVDRSPYGLMDVAGNICEWTSTWEDQSQTARILQGASYNSVAPMCRLDSQMASPPSYRYAHYGFRLALELD
jgi:serine/threonine-protein kinase